MNEYICREAILDDLKKEIEAGSVALDEDLWINKGIKIAIRDIKDIKAADVQPVKRGKWEGVDYNTFFKCSECGHMTDWQRYKYCPYCGARMDGD